MLPLMAPDWTSSLVRLTGSTGGANNKPPGGFSCVDATAPAIYPPLLPRVEVVEVIEVVEVNDGA